MDKTQIVTMSPLVLAYLGDTVYESYIREYLIRGNCNKKVNDLHKAAIKYSNAKAQASIIHNFWITKLMANFRIFRRRNENIQKRKKSKISYFS